MVQSRIKHEAQDNENEIRQLEPRVREAADGRELEEWRYDRRELRIRGMLIPEMTWDNKVDRGPGQRNKRIEERLLIYRGRF